jgi:hypothetical protein
MCGFKYFIDIAIGTGIKKIFGDRVLGQFRSPLLW